MQKLLIMAAMVGLLASPGLAVVVQWSDFEVGTNYGLGLVGENLVGPAGYGPPSSYSLDATIKTTGNTSQKWSVPGDASDPDGEGWMIPGDGGGAFNATNWRDFIMNTLNGPAPAANSPLKFIADVRIDGNPGDLDAAKTFILSNAPSPIISEFDPVNNGAHNFGVWETDFVLLETAFDGAGELSFICILVDSFAFSSPFGDGVSFYMDNLRLEYVPEPASALLLLGGVPLLRRRR